MNEGGTGQASAPVGGRAQADVGLPRPEGTLEGLDTVYARHAGRIRAYFLRSGFAPADAEDLTQETFLRVVRSSDTFDAERGPFGAWLAAIARNVARRRWERRADPDGFDPELAEQTLAAPADERDSPQTREEMSAVGACVEALPRDLARLVRMRYVEGRTTRGISAATGTSEATVRLRLGRALELLEQCLKGKGIVG